MFSNEQAHTCQFRECSTASPSYPQPWLLSLFPFPVAEIPEALDQNRGKCYVLLQSKKHRLTETQHRRELQLKGDRSGSLRFALGRSSAVLTAVPKAEVGRVRTDWHLVAVIFLVLHVKGKVFS